MSWLCKTKHYFHGRASIHPIKSLQVLFPMFLQSFRVAWIIDMNLLHSGQNLAGKNPGWLSMLFPIEPKNRDFHLVTSFDGGYVLQWEIFSRCWHTRAHIMFLLSIVWPTVCPASFRDVKEQSKCQFMLYISISSWWFQTPTINICSINILKKTGNVVVWFPLTNVLDGTNHPTAVAFTWRCSHRWSEAQPRLEPMGFFDKHLTEFADKIVHMEKGAMGCHTKREKKRGQLWNNITLVFSLPNISYVLGMFLGMFLGSK